VRGVKKTHTKSDPGPFLASDPPTYHGGHRLFLKRCAFATHEKTRPGWVVPEEQPTETSDQGGWANTTPLPFYPRPWQKNATLYIWKLAKK
jgi:hypothetical protein